ncbi:MAG: exonuclease domain-containing protein [Acidimicrobiia bacterium]
MSNLHTPLADVTFVVLDLETTGGAPGHDRITEIGALKVRGGELLGHVDTLVNPGVPVPPEITVLTGITEAMVFPAPPIEELLPSLLEFLHGTVIVGHNVRFDCGFLDAALSAHGYPRLANFRVDTLALARRLVCDELPNLRLGTLADHFHTTTVPAHRAYADADATADLLHRLLERAAGYGVLGLDDLLATPSIRPHPTSAKLALTARLPRAPGVYLFRDRAGRALYVGTATDVRAQVRAHFYGDTRHAVPQLLREVARVDHRVCGGPIEAKVRALRAIRRLEPRFNHQTRSWRRYAYLRIPRLTVVHTLRAGDYDALGPFRSARAAKRARSGGAALVRAHALRAVVDEVRQPPRLAFDTPEGRIELEHGRMVLPGDNRPLPALHLALPPRRDEIDELLVVARARRRAG